MRKKKLTLIDEDEEVTDGVEMEGKRREDVTVDVEDDDDDDDEDDLDEFENDGFIVDDEEEEEGIEQDGNKKQNKKKSKRKSLKDLVLDDDDLELLQHNKILGLYQPKTTGTKKFKRLKKAGKGTELAEHSSFSDDGSLFDGASEEEEGMSDEAEDEMADFIVDDEEIYEHRALVRQRKLNGKRPNQAPNVSSSALEEAGSIFGTVDELLKHRKQSLEKNVVIVDNYTTERDDCIRVIDKPERMQMFEEIAGPFPVGKMSLEEESSWILSQLASDMYPLFSNKKSLEGTEDGTYLLNKIKREDITRFLELHHVENYDIPFIAMYRKEMCRSLLEDPELEKAVNKDENDTGKTPRLKWHKVLWIIKELDRKWLLVQKRKSALQMYYNQRYQEHHNIYNDARHTLKEQLFESITRALKMAETERDIDDVDMKFSLHFPPTEECMGGKFRRPKRKSHYSNCSEAGLWQLAGKFGHNYEQFGLQISLEKVGMEFWEDADESPMDVASKYMCPMFETPESVLRGARHMAAVEMSCEPGIRKHVRCIFMDKAVVSTSPTPEGDLAIDSFHQFAGVKWLRDKPVTKFDDSQWLLIHKAEEEKLLKVTIRLPESILDKLITYCNDVYLRDGDARSARLWNEQRKLILHDSFSNFILPSMEKEARALLTARAKIWLLIEYGKQFWDKVSVAPYQRKNVAGLDEGIAPKVMACCWGPGKPEITFVMLGSSGNLLDVLHAGSLCRRLMNVNDQQRKKNDQQRVLKFMLHHQPYVIILGAVNVSCAWLKDAIKEIVNKMVEENSRDVCQAMDGIRVFYGDESLPQLYERSQISSDHLPGQPGIVKRAVALGRYLQNPLAMVATLCGAQREIVSWKLSSLENFLTADEKYEMIEWVMVDVTNQVGVDINLAVSQDWLFAPMQFVSGLGSQKAAFLRKELVEGNVVSNRKELVGFGLRTKKVFYNAIGFMSVRGSEQLSICSENDLLDDTRIHPESYGLAQKLATAVCKDVAEVQPIKYIKDNLQLLNDFFINDYADNYEIEEGEDRRETLNDIKMELLHGFLDPRKPYEEPTQDEEFYMISGKNVDSFAEGRIVQAIVRQVQSQRAFCALDSGLTGIVMKDDYTEESDDFALTDKLHQGDILTCKIKQIDKNRFHVFLTCKESEMKSNKYQNFCDVDPYYCGGPSISITKQEKACNEDELAKKLFKHRMIVHPRFRNMTKDQAVEFLSDKDGGENIFRPSSSGPSYLTLTLKICDGLYVHKDIIEGEKDHKDITSLLHLGKTLKIGNDIFEDLDEVIDRYVDPLVTHLKAMLSFRKFKSGSKSEVDESLRAEKSEYPMRIVYCFGISYEHPGTFILSYIRSTNLHHEYVGLHHEGFKFRKHTFQKVDQLVSYFQKHIDDWKHDSAPIRNPASGSSAGGSDGWQGELNSSRDGSSGSRGRNCYNRGGRGRDGNCGHGRGRGRGPCEYGRDNSGNENEDSGYGTDSKWGMDSKNGDGSDGGWSNFHGDKIQNSPRKEAFPGGWGSGVISDGGGSWDGDSGWNEGSRGGSAGGGNWSRHRDSQGASGSNQGGRGRGHGRGRDSYNNGDNNTNKVTFTAGWGGSGSDSDCGINWGGGGGSTGGWGGSNEGGNDRGGSWGGNEGGGRGRGGNRGSGRGGGRGSGYNNGDEWGGSGSDSAGGINWSGGDSTGGWGGSNEGGNASGGSWGGNKGGGRGRGGNRGSGRGGGRGSGYNNGDEWGRSGSDSAGGINWGGGDSTGGWGGSNEGGSASGGSWGGNEGGGRGRGADRGSGRRGGIGIDGNRGGGSVRGRGCRRGCSNGRGDDSRHEGDFRYKTSSWGANTRHGDTGDKGGSYFPGGSAGDGGGGNSTGGWGGSSVGRSSSVGNWGGIERAKNPGGCSWGGISNDAQGVLGSGPANGSWAAAQSDDDRRNGGSGHKDNPAGSQPTSAGSQGVSAFNTDSETGNTGWGAGSGKNSTLSGGGRGWGGGGSHGW